MPIGTRIGTAYAELWLDQSKFKAGLATAEGSFRASLARMKTEFTGFSQSIQRLTRSLFVVGGAAAAAFTKGVFAAASFEQAMANVGSILGKTQDEMQTLTDFAKQMGIETVFSAKEAAEAMYYLASAGYKEEQIMRALRPALDLAAATQSDLAFTTRSVVEALNMFGLGAEQAGRVANTYAAAIANSQLQMETLADAMVYIGPIAAAMGWSIEDVVAALGKLHDAGFKGSMAGTALRGVLTRIIAASGKTEELLSSLAAEAREELAPAFAEAADDTDQLQEALEEAGIGIDAFIQAAQEGPVALVELFEQAGPKAAELMQIFAQRAGPGAAALIKQGSAAIEELKENITDTTKASEMAAIQLDTFQGQWTILKASIEGVILEGFGPLLPILKDLVQNHVIPAVNNFAAWVKECGGLQGVISELVERFKSWMDTLTGSREITERIISIMGEFLKVYGKALAIIIPLTMAFKALSLVFGPIYHGIRLIVAAFGVLRTAIVGAKGVTAAVNAARASMIGLLGPMSAITAAAAGIGYVFYQISRKIGDANAAFDEYRAKIEGVEQATEKALPEMVPQLLPEEFAFSFPASEANERALNDLIIGLTHAGSEFNQFRQQMEWARDGTIELTATMTDYLIESISKINTEVDRGKVSLGTLRDQFADLREVIQQQAAAWGMSQEEISQAKAVIDAIIAVLENLIAQFGEEEQALGKLTPLYKTLAGNLDAVISKYGEVQTASDTTDQALTTQQTVVQDAEQRWADFESELSRFPQMATELQQSFFSTVNGELASMASLIEYVASGVEDLGDQLAELQTYQQSLSQLAKLPEIELPGFLENLGIEGKQKGGPVPGGGTGDKVPALLEPGEFVIPRWMMQIPWLAKLIFAIWGRRLQRGGPVELELTEVVPRIALAHGISEAWMRTDEIRKAKEELAEFAEQCTQTQSCVENLGQAIQETEEAAKTWADRLSELDPYDIDAVLAMMEEALADPMRLTLREWGTIVGKYGATVGAIEQIIGMWKKLGLETDELEQKLARLKEMFGDLEEAGQSWREWLEGTSLKGLIDRVTDLIPEGAREQVRDFLMALDPKEVERAIGSLAEFLFGEYGSGIVSLLSNLATGNWLGAILDAIDMFSRAIEERRQYLEKAIDFYIDAMTKAADVTDDFISALSMGVLGPIGDILSATIKAFSDALQMTLLEGIDLLAAGINMLVNFVGSLISAFTNLIKESDAYKALQEETSKAWKAVADLLGQFLWPLAAAIRYLNEWLGIQEEVNRTLSDLNVPTGWKVARIRYGATRPGEPPATGEETEIPGWADALGQKIAEAIKGLLESYGISSWTDLLTAWANASTQFWTYVTQRLPDIITTLDNVFGIIGDWLSKHGLTLEGIVDWLIKGVDWLIANLPGMVSDVLAFLDKIGTAISTVWNWISANFSSIWNQVLQNIDRFIDAIQSIGSFDSLINELRGIKNAINALKKGIIYALATAAGAIVGAMYGSGLFLNWNIIVGALAGGALGYGLTALLENMGYFQHGGIVTRPTLGILAEKQPEAVIPLDRLGDLSGEIVIHNVITLDGDKVYESWERRARRKNLSSGWNLSPVVA